jgi:hypothetical protein
MTKQTRITLSASRDIPFDKLRLIPICIDFDSLGIPKRGWN